MASRESSLPGVAILDICPEIFVSTIPTLGIAARRHSCEGHSEVCTLEIRTALGQDQREKNQGLYCISNLPNCALWASSV
jgi:hypothetical protein